MFLIEAATEPSDEIHAAIVRLLPHLTTSTPPPSADQVARIVQSPATTLFLAREEEGGRIVGTLTLAMFQTPTGVRAWIEDVIVDPVTEGRGCGRQLTQSALDAAKAAGARTVELTSRPSREAANHLYRKIGFQPRDTNIYRYELG